MDDAAFFGAIRSTLFAGSLLQAQTDGINAILTAMDKYGVGDQEERAYILATAYWETSRTMQPVREAYWLSEKWRKANLRYYPYYGRGHVQLTWKYNYATFTRHLGVDLVGFPDMALDKDISAYVLVVGMKQGLFAPAAGPLSKYLGTAADWLGARRTVNGVDRKADIAAIAKKFDAAFEIAEGPVHASEPTVITIPPEDVVSPGDTQHPDEAVLMPVPALPPIIVRPTPPPKVLKTQSTPSALVSLIVLALALGGAGFVAWRKGLFAKLKRLFK